MKKALLAIVAIILSVSFAYAGDKYYHDDSPLPQAAKATISKNFKAKVSVVKVDKDFGRISEYDVVLTDGTEISFDRSGNWKEIETSADKSVPAAFIPKAMAEYIRKNHKGLNVVGLEKKSRGGYEATLSNGIEARFDSQGTFLRYDD